MCQALLSVLGAKLHATRILFDFYRNRVTNEKSRITRAEIFADVASHLKTWGRRELSCRWLTASSG
jgi:hypothetical protein